MQGANCMQDLAIIALEYLEPEWQQTLDCVKATGLPYFIAKRDGVGNMSRAFNEAYDKYVSGRYKYVWLVTNILFSPDVPKKLIEAFYEDCDLLGVHPSMKGSDHAHQIPDGSGEVKYVRFIELTAPMFYTDSFDSRMLCEETPYWYMDLIISHQLKQVGEIAVHHGCEVSHEYLRNTVKKSVHPITKIRHELRSYFKKSSLEYLVKTYGENWKELLWNKNAIE